MIHYDPILYQRKIQGNGVFFLTLVFHLSSLCCNKHSQNSQREATRKKKKKNYDEELLTGEGKSCDKIIGAEESVSFVSKVFSRI